MISCLARDAANRMHAVRSSPDLLITPYQHAERNSRIQFMRIALAAGFAYAPDGPLRLRPEQEAVAGFEASGRTTKV